MTSKEGVFAGGDVTTGPSTVIQCIANGHIAARGINKYLGVEEGHTCVGKQIKLPFLSFDAEGIEETEGLKLSEIPKEKRNLDDEDEIVTTMEEAMKEAARCMNCGCYSVNPSDTAPALIALGATIKTNQREMSAADFCCTEADIRQLLNEGEVVTAIEIPVLKDCVMHYDKFRVRESVDFAIVSMASIFGKEDGKIARSKLILGGVAPVPVRLNEVEAYLAGKDITEEVAKEAGEIAVRHAIPMSHNKYKITEIQAMVESAIMRLA